MWEEIEPRHYERRIEAVGLIRAFMMAFVLYVPALQYVASRCHEGVKAAGASTLSYALRRASSLGMVRALMDRLQDWHRPQAGQLIAIDSMALSLPRSCQHGCKPVNRRTVGGGVLWAFMIEALAGVNPVKVLKIISGPWHDTQAIVAAPLAPRGPVYLMDPGFWAIDLVRRWLADSVHFIVRANKSRFTYHALRRLGRPRALADGTRVQFDGLARLGGPQRRDKPVVRLVIATARNGSHLILVTDMMRWGAQEILAAYKKRAQIERFHRFLKETVGLAHLYSFQENGIMFLLHVATLLAILLLLALASGQGLTATLLLQCLKAVRAQARLLPRWKPNTVRARRKKKRSIDNTVTQEQNH